MALEHQMAIRKLLNMTTQFTNSLNTCSMDVGNSNI